MAVIANLPQYALGLPIVPTACPDDGLLDVRIFQHRSAFELLKDLAKVWRGRSEPIESVIHLQGRRFRIESDRPLSVQADGDPVGMTPIEITVEPASATLYTP